MQINLFSITSNNERTIEQFIDFYKARVPNINIHLYDIMSYDKTLELARAKGAITHTFGEQYIKEDDWKNNCWKTIPGDCVIIVNQNEYVDITPLLFQNATIITCRAYNTYSLNSLLELPENRNPDLDRVVMFDPKAIKDMHFEGVDCNPQGFVRIGEKQPIMYKLIK